MRRRTAASITWAFYVKILAIINHPSALPYLIGQHIEARGAACHSIDPHQGDTVPADPDGFAGLLVLGGAMSAGDRDYDHVFEPVTALIRAFHGGAKPVLGVCLGSQLLARSFDKPVYPHADLEVGYVPLTITEAGASDPLLRELAPDQTIFEWHEDTFELPDGAELLMTGQHCRNQAFRIGTSSYGFQCHFEVDAPQVLIWLEAGRENLLKHRGARAEAVDRDIRAQIPQYVAGAVQFAHTVTHKWMDLVVERADR